MSYALFAVFGYGFALAIVLVFVRACGVVTTHFDDEVDALERGLAAAGSRFSRD